MENSPILLFDPLIERACDTQFLLTLAKYQVSMVHNDDEAFNWIISRHESAEQLALLLVNDFQADMPILKLIPQLREQGVKVPVLFISRDELVDCTAAAVKLDAVFCCRPENMLSQVRVLSSAQ